MAKHLIVALDGSERAERAIPIALSLAATSGATLVFACASAEAELTDPEGYLGAAAFAWGVPEAETVVLYDRMAPAALQYLAAEYADPVLCMTTRGRGAVSTAILGSVATEVLHEVACPLVLAGPNLDPEPWVPGPIIVGLDGEHEPGRLMGAVATFAAMLDVPLWLAQVLPGRATPSEPGIAAVESAYVEDQARPLRAAGLAVGWDVLHADNAANALLDLARMHEAHMIAVATRARKGVGGLVFGSVTRDLLQSSPLPVLITHVGA